MHFCGRVSLVLAAKLICVLSAEPRPVFMEEEKHPVMDKIKDLLTPEASENVHRYAKILQRPLAFSYFDDDGANKVKTKRDNKIVKKLESKRILIPKRKPDKEFLIYADYEEKQPVVVENDYDYVEDAQIEQSKKVSIENKEKDSAKIAKKEIPVVVDKKHEKGGGKDYKSDKYDHHGGKGNKKYEDKHQEQHKEMGHHDKSADRDTHKEDGGKESKYEKTDGYKADHRKGDKGEKGGKYEENGKHEKGHSTKGSHNIHKKEEYEKKEEFYDESEEGDDFEKASGFFEEDDFHKGGHVKKDHKDIGHHHDSYGKENHYEKGSTYNGDKKHKKGAGKDSHYNHHNKHTDKEGKHAEKKWSHNKHPKPKKAK